MRHLIRKQTFEISAPTLRLAQRWESSAARWIHDVIAPSLERCFDQASAEDATLQVDQLEIDLGVVHESVSPEDIADRVTRAVWSALNPRPSPDLRVSPARVSRDAHAAAGSETSPPLSGTEATVECFLRFLAHGTLPWWAEGDALPPDGAWFDHVISRDTARLQQVLSAHVAAPVRLVQQFGAGFAVKVMTALAPAHAGAISEAWASFEKAFVVRGPRLTVLRRAYLAYWLARSAGGKVDDITVVRAVRQWIEETSEARSRVYTLFLDRLLNDATDQPPVLQEIRNLLKVEWDNLIHTDPGKALPEVTKNTWEARAEPHRAANAPPGDAPRLRGEPESNLLEPEKTAVRNAALPAPVNEPISRQATQGDAPRIREDDTDLYVEAAGLVLFHPFLPELFQSEYLWEQNAWASPEAQHIAVHLVSWLAYGETGIPEYRLMMPKLLCGMPWSEVLDTGITLDADRLRSGLQLIEAVIDHWRVLGNTSPDGLREGFVLRSGKLAPRNDGWMVTVERKAQDILLNRLPWGISLIHLPWLQKRRIHVDWT